MDAAATTVQAGTHRISASVFGSGEPAVVIEPAYGGAASSWRFIAEAAARETTVVAYDRAPYGDSSAARDSRTPRDVARDLHAVLDGLHITRPLVLVGHSIGGIYARAYAASHPDSVAGMVLVDSSHEGQRRATRGHVPWEWQFMELLTIPSIIAASRAARKGADRRSLIREFRSFLRITEADRMLFPGALGGKPLVVLTRARDTSMRDRGFWPIWHGLHADLARLSANSSHIISNSANHYLNDGDPTLIIDAIRLVVASARTSEPLATLGTSGECARD
ncbi:MAG TPA: alpha/beta hydrolase [Trebonia sp.]|jgi:pimeloyl-ACP methyl ester carboxylesterase|nr:alpha/beta hydrolase [Trebonia sp.]